MVTYEIGCMCEQYMVGGFDYYLCSYIPTYDTHPNLNLKSALELVEFGSRASISFMHLACT